MCCNRSNRCRCRNDNVLGIQRIALRGPGCINGTGQCDGVLGTGGNRRCETVLGTGGNICCGTVLGAGGNTCCGAVLGTGGSIRPNPSRNRCDHGCLWDSLVTPTTVPR